MKRRKVQWLYFLGSNAYGKGFLNGRIFKGISKHICVPGLQCYSCPGALGACPIGSLQAVMGSMKYQVSFYVSGLLVLFGTIFGRVICGYLCPFGLIQDLMYQIKSKKYQLPKYLRTIKYLILIYFVILIPTLFASSMGIGDPGFCKYICPSGTLFGALPLLVKNQGLRTALGGLFIWKLAVLVGILLSSIFVYRSFCQTLCPLGLIYGWFNRISILGLKVDTEKCNHCGRCQPVCKLGLNPQVDLTGVECIQCGECEKECKQGAIKRGIS
jgi:hypothetical protein